MMEERVEDLDEDLDDETEDEGGIYTLTFDCYGTLIDWHGGVIAAAERIPSLAGCDLERLERDRERHDKQLILGPYRPYGEILAESLVLAAREQGREVSPEEARALAASMRDWPPFDETRGILAKMAERYQLAILSNVETAVLEASTQLLGVPFEALVTAERVRSYKPNPLHWHTALDELGVAKENVLHVACSLYHDVEPATELGIDVAYVNRDGVDVPPGLEPKYVVSTLTELWGRLGRP